LDYYQGGSAIANLNLGWLLGLLAASLAFAVLGAWLLLGERPHPLQGIGALFSITGVLLTRTGGEEKMERTEKTERSEKTSSSRA